MPNSKTSKLHMVHNGITSLFFALLLVGPVLLSCVNASGLSLPEFVTAESAKNLSGSNKTVDLTDSLNINAFLAGDLQETVELEVENHIPFKAVALLQNAALQRELIAGMACLYGYRAYPTYYGSSVIHISPNQALSLRPNKNSDTYLDGYKAFGKRLGTFAASFPETRFFVILPLAGGLSSAFDPMSELVSNAVTASQVEKTMEEALSSSKNIYVVSDIGDFDNLEEYYDNYYRTDHHWNIKGTCNVFNHLLSSMGKEPRSFSPMQLIPNCSFNGSRAREGLEIIDEEVFDCAESFNDVTLVREGGGEVAGSDHGTFFSTLESRTFDFYGRYYTTAPLYKSNGRGSCLLISDSFGNSFARPVAQLYQETHHVKALHHEAEGYSLKQLMDEFAPNDVIFVAQTPGYKDVVGRMPGFFAM